MADTNQGEEAEAAGKPQNNPDRDLVFYYSREHRLSRSSPIVQSMNENPGRSGFSGRLFGSKSNLMLFASIALICLMFGLTARISGSGSNLKLGGNSIDMVILLEDGKRVLEITKKAPQQGEVYFGPVDIAVAAVPPKGKENAAAEDIPMFFHSVEFKAVETETFRVVLPLDGSDFFVTLKSAGEQKSMRVKHSAARRK